MTNKSVETSEFGQSTLVVSRVWVAILIAIFGFLFWNDRTLIESSRSAAAACLWFLSVASLIGLVCYLLGVLMRSAKLSLSFDREGLWRTHLGREQGLVRWGDIRSVKEGRSALTLFDRAGRLVLKVEYERGSYFTIRTRIMQGMSFQPPSLPMDASLPGAKVSGWIRLAFACMALLCVGGGVLSISAPRSDIWVPLLLCAVLSGLFAFPRLRVIFGIHGIQIRKKTYSYSAIRAVDASFMRVGRGQRTPRLTLDEGVSKPVVILTRGCAIDSLTLQRILLWAMARSEVKSPEDTTQ